jgi:hypothetical protein
MLMFHIGLISGPPLAGFLLASHGPALVYAINAASFVADIVGLGSNAYQRQGPRKLKTHPQK